MGQAGAVRPGECSWWGSAGCSRELCLYSECQPPLLTLPFKIIIILKKKCKKSPSSNKATGKRPGWIPPEHSSHHLGWEPSRRPAAVRLSRCHPSAGVTAKPPAILGGWSQEGDAACAGPPCSVPPAQPPLLDPAGLGGQRQPPGRAEPPGQG